MNTNDKSGWISVEDWLPEFGDTVLTFPHYKVLPFGNKEEDKHHDLTDTDFWEWQGDNETGSHCLARPRPTHWMPLPQPPQTKNS